MERGRGIFTYYTKYKLAQPIKKLYIYIGVPVMVQWKQIRLGTMRVWVRSLASLSGLKIQRCCELWCRLQTQLGSGVAVAVV